MECTTIEEAGLAVDYAAGRLDPAVAEEFEHHYMSCARCARLAALAQALGAELRSARVQAPRPRRRFLWAGLLSLAAALAVGVVLVFQSRDVPRAPARSAPLEPQAPRRSDAPGTEAAWARAMAFEMPRYSAPLMRSDPGARSAELRRAMEPYRRGDWAAAQRGLQPLAAREDTRAAALFFLGAIHLPLGQPAEALARFDAVIALGNTAYLEEAQWYSAKALLAQGDIERARERLQIVVKQDGDLVDQARRLLKESESFRPKPSSRPR
jgi:tetratricopeptide (TPR) repeat protein